MKHVFLSLASCLCLWGCVRAPSPYCDFEEVKQNVYERSCQIVCWNREGEVAAPKHLTLERAVSVALLNNPDLQATYETLGIAKAGLTQAGLLTNPLFDFSYRFSTQAAVTDLIDLGIFQNFLEILLIPLKKRIAQSELEATKAHVATQALEVIANTKSAFYTLQAKEEMYALKKQILLAADASFDAAQRLFKAGNIKELEVVENRVTMEQKKLEVAQGELELFEAREALNRLLGLWGTDIQWTLDTELPPLPEGESNWGDVETSAIAQSLDLEEARWRLCATAAGFGLDTSRLVFPEFSLGASAEREEGVWFVGPAFALALPIFDFGQAISVAARSEIMRQWKGYTALAIEIRSAARMARLRLMHAERKRRFYETLLIPLSEQLTTLTLWQLNAMQIGVFQLLETKIQELETKMGGVENLEAYWVMRTDLELLLSGHMRDWR